MGGFFSRLYDYFDPTPDDFEEDERQRLEREASERSFRENAANFSKGLSNTFDRTFGLPKHGYDLLSGYTTGNLRINSETDEVESPTIGQLVGPAFVPPVNEERSVVAKAVDFLDPIGETLRKVPALRQASSKLAEKGIDVATDPNFPGLGKLGRGANTALGTYFAARGAEGGGSQIGTGLSKLDQGKPVEAIGDFTGGLFDLGMAGLGGKHLKSELTPLARKPFGDVNLTFEGGDIPPRPISTRDQRIAEFQSPDRFMTEAEGLRKLSSEGVEASVPKTIPNEVSGFLAHESRNSPGIFHTWFEHGNRQSSYLVKPHTLELGTVFRDPSVPPWMSSLDVEHPVSRAYSHIGERANLGEIKGLESGPLTKGSVRARSKLVPTDLTLEMAVQAAKVDPVRLSQEATFLPGTTKSGENLQVQDVAKGIRDITARQEYTPEAQAIRHAIDRKWVDNPLDFQEAYGKPEPIESIARKPGGEIVSGAEAYPNIPQALGMIKEKFGKLIPESTPSSQRGAVGDIGPLNRFEDSQQKKYGSEWRTKQSPEEAAFHQRLLKGEGSFKQAKTKAASTEPESVIEPVEDISKAEEVSPTTETEKPYELINRVVKRPDGTEIRIETTAENQIKVTKTRKDGSIISVEEGPDFDTLKESYEVFEPSKETPLSVIREKAAEREKAFRENVRLRDRLIKAQNAEEVRMITQQMKDNLSKVQDPSKPTESDTFGEAWNKLDRGGKALESLNIMRSLKSAIDTPILRQGRIVTFNNPKVAFEAARKMSKVVLSKEQFDTLHNDIAQDPTYKRFSDLGKDFVPDIPGVSGLREEAFPSPLAEKIPGVGKTIVAPSDRAYTAFMNSARLSHWKKNINRLEKRGITPENHPEVFQDLARVTNLVTFRADTKNKIVKSIAESNIAGNVFYSPRNKMSQIQILKNMLPFGSNLSSKGGLASPRNVLRKQVAQTWAINAAIYGSLAYAGIGTIEKDPESSDFLKFKVGNKRYNPWLGTNQIIRAALLMATGKSKTLSGKDRNVSPEEVAGREIRKSLAPGPGLLWDLYSGKNVVGEKVREKEDSLEKQVFDSSLYALKNGLTPMSIDDIIREYRQSGLASSIGSVTIPGLAGENVSVYEDVSEKPSSTSKRKKKKYQLAF